MYHRGSVDGGSILEENFAESEENVDSHQHFLLFPKITFSELPQTQLIT